MKGYRDYGRLESGSRSSSSKGWRSCLTAAFLVFFISALSGEDLLKNHSTIKDLDRIQGDIST
ncbi:MAG: hypothetical protein MZV70_37865 [Desulfobacterales bacterium]|nr:hypothetical protein [Desulfobacterales bacterium]